MMHDRNGNGPDTGRDAALERELNALKREYQGMKSDLDQTSGELRNLEAHLAQLQQEAEAAYGTSDPDELARLLEEKRAENERLVAEYRQHLDGIKAGLSALENGGNSGEPA